MQIPAAAATHRGEDTAAYVQWFASKVGAAECFRESAERELRWEAVANLFLVTRELAPAGATWRRVGELEGLARGFYEALPVEDRARIDAHIDDPDATTIMLPPVDFR